MEATREIYWNIGHGVVLPMYILTLAAVGVLAWGFWKRLPLYRMGKPLNRTDRYEERVRRMIGDMLGQEKVARVRDGGLPHNLFFWGFLTLFVGTLIIMVQADFLTPVVKVNLLSGEFYKAFSLVLDLAGLVALVMLGALFVRRYFIKPEGLETRDEDMVIHTILFVILLTGFLIEGARMAATELVQQPELAS
ncbi:MAG TPA: respiratory nitrate reductase subunit gamma, partial [Geobacteraceae bacterium]|nr:respiratory nitrate reductase subunit gamma [Geobacteraceae bacterium]